MEAIKTEKPWGYEILFARTSYYAGKVIFVKKGHRLSLQYHKKKDESLYLYDGTTRIEIEEEPGTTVIKTASSGLSIRILPNIRHRIEAIEDCTFFEVSTPELEDVVRVEDDYGRA